MYIVLVHVRVKADDVPAFVNATLDNAKCSILEPGIIRFDVVREQEDPTKFILIEVYHTAEDALKHKDTGHYLRWRDTVAEMMAEPRKGVKYIDIFPDEAGWSYGG